jgi:acyl dehydratase
VPGYDTRSVHGEQDCRFEGAIRSGMVLRSRAAVAGVHPRSTGTLLVTKTETRDDAGSLRNQLYFMSFLRGVSVSCGVGERPPERLLPADRGRLVAEVTDYVAEDQSLRYAEASGDYGSYHVDETAARAAGFPSVIVHGLCTMAFACRAVVAATCGEEPHRLNRFAVRFSRPLLPGQMVTTTIWHGGHRDGRAVFAVELADAAGRPVITQGLAEVRQ